MKKTPATETDEAAEKERDFKLELYGLSAFATEEVWQIVTIWTKNNNNSLGEWVVEGDKPALKTWTEAETVSNFSKTESVAEAFYLLQKHSRIYLRDAANFWERYQEELTAKQDSALGPMELQSKKVYLRLQRLLLEGRHTTKRDDDGKPVESSAAHIGAGMNTGEGLMLSIQQVIIENFQEQYGRPITQDEFKQISKSGRTLIMHLASISNYLFDPVMRELKVHGSHSQFNVFKREVFSFTEKNNIKTLEIKPETLAKILGSVTRTKIPVGTAKCPAILAPGQDGKNVIAEMYDWYEGLIIKNVLPQLKRLTTEEK